MIKKFDFAKLPIVEIVNELILDCIKRGVSDIHLDPTSGPLKIRIRIDGSLIDYAEAPVEYLRNLVTRIKILSGMNITESRLTQDGAIKTEINNMAVDLRVSSLPTNLGEKIVIRILDYTMSAQGLEHLGFSTKNFKKVNQMINEPNGIILVTGATGSGKSTTVYSILQRLNSEDVNLISVEDPVEMNIEGINQVQVNSDIGLDFAHVLRSILRQDPDIVMIGEIRDTETAQIAVRASITGHLVLSTLHTNDALSTIERLMDMEVERYLLSSSLAGLVAQKLARKLCDKCKTQKQVNTYEKKIMKLVLNQDIDKLFFPGPGCDECREGFKGRIAIHEVLLVNQEIRDAISGNVDKAELRKLVYSSDVTTALADGLEKALQGITTIEEVIKLIEMSEDSEVGDTMNHLQQALADTKQAKNKKVELDPKTAATASNKGAAIPATPPVAPTAPPVPAASTPKVIDVEVPKAEMNVNLNNAPLMPTAATSAPKVPATPAVAPKPAITPTPSPAPIASSDDIKITVTPAKPAAPVAPSTQPPVPTPPSVPANPPSPAPTPPLATTAPNPANPTVQTISS